MRVRIPVPLLISFSALALASCGHKTAADNSAVAEQNAETATIVTNDVTAIDAATSEAANMAADVNYTFNEATVANNGANAARPARKAKAAPAAPANTSTEATGNNAM